jgi:glyceraldehyde 3-phosphate dehydrogenase
MSIRIGINGLGRIGRLVFRLAAQTEGVEVVHVNDRMDIDLIVHLIKYDSVHGRFGKSLTHNKNTITLDGRKILVTRETSPSIIPWQENNVDIVVDSSGKFKSRELLKGHMDGGVRKVVLCCPADDNSVDKTIVMGVNNTDITAADNIISNASCTANCVAVVAKVLEEEFGIERAFLNTVHPFTNNQNLQDGYHQDFRRARSAMNNIIPTTSTAINVMDAVMPQLSGKIDGFATRVPVADCSFVEMTVQLKRNVAPEEVNSAFKAYADGVLSSYLDYCTDPIVSSDITNIPASAVYDSLSIKVLGGDLIQFIAWYDNEYGYSARVIDLVKYIALK